MLFCTGNFSWFWILTKSSYICNPLERNFIEIKIYCGMEQLAARWAHNPKVVGSSPAPATKKA